MSGHGQCMQDRFSGVVDLIKAKNMAMEASLVGLPLSHKITQIGNFDLFQIDNGEQLQVGFGKNYHGHFVCKCRN